VRGDSLRTKAACPFSIRAAVEQVGRDARHSERMAIGLCATLSLPALVLSTK
jgi:hypothetical protein